MACSTVTATIFHVFFCIDNEDDFACASEVSKRAVKTGVNFAKITCQQTVFIVGIGLIQEEVQAYKIGMLCIHRSIQYLSLSACMRAT